MMLPCFLSFCPFMSVLPCSFFSSWWWRVFADWRNISLHRPSCHLAALPSSHCICPLVCLPPFFSSLLSTFSLFSQLFSRYLCAGNLGRLWRTAGRANDKLRGYLTHVCRVLRSNLCGRGHREYAHVNPDERQHCFVPCEKRTAPLPAKEVGCCSVTVV